METLLTKSLKNVPNCLFILFTYFPGLGHALDRRSSYDDLLYDTMSPDAKKTLVRQLRELF